MTTDPYPPKNEPVFDHESEDRFFVSLFDPTGTMVTARKMREHLTLAEAKALQADVTEQGGLLLIYKEKRPPHQPDSVIGASFEAMPTGEDGPCFTDHSNQGRRGGVWR